MEGLRVCSVCREERAAADFSRKQWISKAHRRKCKKCVGSMTTDDAIGDSEAVVGLNVDEGPSGIELARMELSVCRKWIIQLMQASSKSPELEDLLKDGLERCVKALEDASDLQAAAANCDTETKEAEDLGDMQGLLEATLAELKTAQVELEQERCKSAAAATAAVLREKQDAEMLESTQDEVRQLQFEFRELLSTRALQEQHTAGGGTAAGVAQDMQALKEQQAAGEALADSLKQQVTGLAEQLAALRQELGSKDLELRALGTQRDALEHEKLALTSAVEELREEHAAMQESTAAISDRHESLLGLSVGLEQTISKLEGIMSLAAPCNPAPADDHARPPDDCSAQLQHAADGKRRAQQVLSPASSPAHGKELGNEWRARGQRLSEELDRSLRSECGQDLDVGMVLEEVRMLERALEQCEGALAGQMADTAAHVFTVSLTVAVSVCDADDARACATRGARLGGGGGHAAKSPGTGTPGETDLVVPCAPQAACLDSPSKRSSWQASPAAHLAREESEYEKRHTMHTRAMQACMAQMDSLRSLLSKERGKSSRLEEWIALGHAPAEAAAGMQAQGVMRRVLAWVPPVAPTHAAAAADDRAFASKLGRVLEWVPPATPWHAAADDNATDTAIAPAQSQPRERQPTAEAAAGSRRRLREHLEERTPSPEGAEPARAAEHLEERTPSPMAFMFAPSPHPAPARPSQERPAAGSCPGLQRPAADARSHKLAEAEAEQHPRTDHRPQRQEQQEPADSAQRASCALSAPASSEDAPCEDRSVRREAGAQAASASIGLADASIDAARLTPEMAQAIVERVRSLSPEAAARLGFDALDPLDQATHASSTTPSPAAGASSAASAPPAAPANVRMDSGSHGSDGADRTGLGYQGNGHGTHQALSAELSSGVLAALPLTTSARDKERRSEIFAHLDPNRKGHLSLAQVERGLRALQGLGGLYKIQPAIRRAFNAVKVFGRGGGRGSGGGARSPLPDGVGRSEFRMLFVYLKLYYELWEILAALHGERQRVGAEQIAAAWPRLAQWGLRAADMEDALLLVDAGGGSVPLDHLCDLLVSRNVSVRSDQQKASEHHTQEQAQEQEAPERGRGLPPNVLNLPGSANRFGYGTGGGASGGGGAYSTAGARLSSLVAAAGAAGASGIPTPRRRVTSPSPARTAAAARHEKTSSPSGGSPVRTGSSSGRQAAERRASGTPNSPESPSTPHRRLIAARKPRPPALSAQAQAKMRGVATRGASNAPQMAADARAQDGPGSGAFAEGAQERGRQDEDDCWTSGDDGDAGDPARALQSEPDPRLDPGGLCFAARAPASPASGRLGPWEGEAERPSSYHDAEESRASWLPSPVSLQVDQTLVVSPEAPETKTPVQQSADMLYQVAADLCSVGRLQDAEEVLCQALSVQATHAASLLALARVLELRYGHRRQADVAVLRQAAATAAATALPEAPDAALDSAKRRQEGISPPMALPLQSLSAAAGSPPGDTSDSSTKAGGKRGGVSWLPAQPQAPAGNSKLVKPLAGGVGARGDGQGGHLMAASRAAAAAGGALPRRASMQPAASTPRSASTSKGARSSTGAASAASAAPLSASRLRSATSALPTRPSKAGGSHASGSLQPRRASPPAGAASRDAEATLWL